MSFFEELKRRNVFRVGIAYAVASWVLLQVADVVLEAIEAPSWVLKALMLLIALGFVAALIIAWAYEITPEGIKREADVDRSQSVVADTGRKLDRIIIAFLAVAVVLLLADRFIRPPGTAGQDATQVQVQEQTKAQEQQVAKTIAVLPFADLSQAQDQEWFADGLAEEILNALAKTPDLLVSSRTSSFRYKGSDLAVSDIAKELGVVNILEGSVRSSGDRIRVTAQLIRTSDGFHLWSENYDRDVADMIAIQEDLAMNIARALKTTMDPEALAAMTSAGTSSVAAYEEYLRGLNIEFSAYSESETGHLYQQAYQHFEKARTLDPGFAAAHFRAANFWRTQLTPSRTDSGLTSLGPREQLTEFNQRIDLAISTARSETDAQGYKAHKAQVEMRSHEAIHLFKTYLEARPNDELVRAALYDTAGTAWDMATRQQIVAHWRESINSSVDAALSYANGAYRAIDPKTAAEGVQQILQRWPNHVSILYQAHRTYLWAGRIQDARSVMEQYQRLVPEGNFLMGLRQACAEGRRDEADNLFAAQTNFKAQGSTRWHALKLLGREQEAIEELRGIAQSGIPYQIADMLSYGQFDPAPYPELVASLKRQGINRPPAIEIPFKCPPPAPPSVAGLSVGNMSSDGDLN